MSNEHLQEVFALTSMPENTDLDKRLLAIVHFIKKYKLDRDNKINKGLRNLSIAVKKEEKILAISLLSDRLDELIKEKEPSVKEYFPNVLTANVKSIVSIEELIKKNIRIKNKLREMLDNFNDLSYRKSHISSLTDNSDLFSLYHNLGNGLTIRILHFVDGKKFRICDVLINHDEYMRNISSKRYFKRYFKNNNWLLIPKF